MPLFRLGLFAVFLALLAGSVFAAEEPGKEEVRALKILNIDPSGRAMVSPSGLFFDAEQEEVYVLDRGARQFVVFASDYFPQITLDEGRGLGTLHGLFVRKGKLFVCVDGSEQDPRGHIVELNQAYMPLRRIYPSGFEGAKDFLPRKLVVADNGNFYVVGQGAPSVVVLDPDGKYLRSIESRLEVLGISEVAKIVSIALGKDGRLYLLSEEMSKVFVYDQQERLLFSFGKKGGIAGSLSRPRGIAVDDREGRIYLVDYMRHAVSVYSTEGGYLFEFGGRGVGRGWFSFPNDVAVDGHGNVLVADTFNQRVQVFKIGDDEPEEQLVREEEPGVPPQVEEEPAPEEKPRKDSLREIERFVRTWAEAWSGQDVDGYLLCYSPDFKVESYLSNYRKNYEGIPDLEKRVPARGIFSALRSAFQDSRQRWESFRRHMLLKPGYVRLKVEDLKVELQGVALAKVSFSQDFSSDTYHDFGAKEMTLQREEGGWKVLEELFALKHSSIRGEEVYAEGN